MFGMLNNNNSYSNNTISNSTVTVSLKNADGLTDEYKNFGKIVGRTGTITDGGGNTATEVVIYLPTKDVANLTELSAAVAKGGYVSIKSGTTIAVTGSVTLSKPAVIDIPDGSKLSLGSNMITNTSELTVMGEGTFEGSSFLLINDGGKTTIEGGRFISSGGQDTQPVRNHKGEMKINGGYFESKAGAAVLTNFANGDTGSLEINDGTFVNKQSGQYALHMYGNGDCVINGGTFIGYFGCARAEGGMRATINGGDFVCYGSGTYYALAVDPETNVANSEVTVNGGNFWSSNTTLYCRNSSTLMLKGGMFKDLNNCADKVAEGYAANDVNISKTYSVDGLSSISASFSKQVARK